VFYIIVVMMEVQKADSLCPYALFADTGLRGDLYETSTCRSTHAFP
jgi:hypothetical protein